MKDIPETASKSESAIGIKPWVPVVAAVDFGRQSVLRHGRFPACFPGHPVWRFSGANVISSEKNHSPGLRMERGDSAGLDVHVVGSGNLLFGTSIEQQLDKASRQIDESAERVQESIDSRPGWKEAIGRMPFSDKVPDFVADSSQRPVDLQDSDKAKRTSAVGDRNGETESSNRAQPSGDNPAKTAKGASEQRASDSSEIANDALAATGKVFSMFRQFIMTGFGLLANLAIIFFVGVFIAVDPTLYRDGIVKLLPKSRREKAREVMNKMGLTIYNWLNGRFLTMLLTGVGTGIGLWLLGVPLAFVIGAITALLTFIPNIGAVASLALAMLMGLSQSPDTVLWVVILYGSWQLIESNIITPLIQQQKTSIPPALLIMFQLLMGVMTGFLGLLVATPLLAALLVFVKEVWIKGVLDDDTVETPELNR